MKKTIISWIAVIMVTVLFAGCGGVVRPGQETESETEIKTDVEMMENPSFGGEILDDTAIFIFTDENLQEIMQELKTEYHMLRPTVEVVDSYGSTEDLAEQIGEGEPCDVFFYVSGQQTDGLKEEGWIVEGSEQVVTEQGDATYSVARIVNDAADELERNAAADFVVFLLSDKAKEIYN